MTNIERKLEAIQAMHKEIGDTSGYTTDQVAAKIRELSPVIKSAKWRDAVEAYAKFVEAYPESLNWAYFQGSVHFGYAVL